MNPNRPFATHVAVRDGRILGAGSLEELGGWGEVELDTRFADKVILPGFDPEHVLSTIAAERVTHMYLPPTALYGLLGSSELGKHDTSSLRIFILVGSPVAPDKLRIAVETFGPCMCQCYGQVEAPMIVTWLPPETVAAAAAGDHPERLASCGKPTRSVSVGIMDDEGNLLPNGTPGEIVVRGPLVSKRYFERPEATAEVRTFGWHHTGDVAYRDGKPPEADVEEMEE